MTNEILNDAQLDNISGGFIDVDKTNGEYFSLGVRVNTHNLIVGGTYAKTDSLKLGISTKYYDYNANIDNCPVENAKGYDIKF